MAKIYEKARELSKRYKDKISPCAICGNSDVQFWPDREWWPQRYVWSLNCMTPNCDFVIANNVKEAIEKWNKQQASHMSKNKER